jgi:hypothetical protein
MQLTEGLRIQLETLSWSFYEEETV